MMAHHIQMPKLGQTVEESTLVRWFKSEGDIIAKGDVLFEIETDKAVLEVESFFEGTLLKILVAEGETVPVLSTVGFVGEVGEELPEVTPPPSPVQKSGPKKNSADIQAQVTAAGSALPVAPHAAAAVPERSARSSISPRARKLAKDAVIDPQHITGTGPDGRIVEKDVEIYLDARGYHDLRITPAAKSLAAKESLDVLAIEGTADGNKIVVADVERAVAEKPKPMSKMRQIIAERLTRSITTAPHFFVTVPVDMTGLIELRAELKTKTLAFSITDYAIMSVVLALKEFPDVNGSTDGKSVVRHSNIHLGLAVALDDGLVVPVIRNADDMTFGQLHDSAAKLVDKARGGTLIPEEMQGSTFTMSNMGMLDVENFTAIINPGEAAILAVSSIIKKPVVRDDEIRIRSMMKMTLSSDHRIVDGATAAGFMNCVKDKLENAGFWKNML
jgi:pyruvate dehydrogenase E2 component (dihydrolipoamide acetyltransferase)